MDRARRNGIIPWALRVLAAVCAPGLLASQVVGGQLMVAPTRVVLEGRNRAAEVLVINGGKEAATFRISLGELEMDEEGRTRAPEGGAVPWSAAPMVRFSPRQVTLAAGASQSVRIQVRKPEGLAPGEYRSHLYFQAVPPPRKAAEAEAPGEGQIAISIRAVFGLSIPVIVRHGPTQVRTSLATPAVQGEPARPRLAVRILREGNQSAFGDLVATWQPRGAKGLPAGRLNGIAVYANLAERRISLDLEPPGGKPLGGGTLKLAYVEHGGTRVLAETALDLP